MTSHRDLKSIIRQRQLKTGESYTAARSHVMRERTLILGCNLEEVACDVDDRVDAVVLKVNLQSVRVRILGESGQVTVRSADASRVVPGHLVTLALEKRWTWREEAYATGRLGNPRVAVGEIGLVPLPLHGGEVDDVRSHYEGVESPDPYAPLWRRLTAQPRAWFEMDELAWAGAADAGLEADDDDPPVVVASHRIRQGDLDGARRLLMDALAADLRYLDAHAHLGLLEFDDGPQRALVHYEIGTRIGDLSLWPGFDGLLAWGQLYNRPFLRCLHGYGLCLWRLGRLAEAQEVFERLLALNPNDNQGVRFCWQDVREGRSWEESSADAAST